MKLFLIYPLLVFSYLAASQPLDSIYYQSLLDSAEMAVDSDLAMRFAREALSFAEVSGHHQGVVDASVVIGNLYRSNGKYEEGIEFVSGLISKTQFDEKELSTYYNLIGIFHVYMGHYDSTEYYFLKSLTFRKQLQDSTGVSAALNNLGNVSLNMGDLEKATSYFLESLQIREFLNDSAGIASSTNNLGLVFYKRKMFVEAIENYLRALKLNKLLNDDSKEVLIYTNLGNTYDELDSLSKAEFYYTQALDKANNLQNNRLVGIATLNLGALKMRLGEFEASESLLLKSLEIRTASNDQQGQAEILSDLASLEIKRGIPRKAIPYFLQSIEITEQIGLKEVTQLNYLGMSDAYEKAGDFESALKSHQRYVAMKDEMLNEANQRSINELIAKYETEKKEQQIALQEAQIAEQQAQLQLNLIFIIALIVVVVLVVAVALLNKSRAKKQQELLLRAAELQLKEAQIESAIASQEQERKRFARDLHDGFGQFISVLNLNLKSLEKGAGNREEVFENSATVLDQMYRELKTICFNLMPETLIKQGVVNGIREFSDRIRTTGKVAIEVDTFGMEDRLEDLHEISIYRITQEWVNNIIKYSDATKINIQLTRDESEITLLIEDDGTGFDQSLLTNGKGNGWKNLNSRANLIKGELELDTSPGIKGNTLILNVPVRMAAHVPA